MTLTIIAWIIAVLAIVLIVASFVLPGQVHVERSRVVDSDQTSLFDLVSSNSGYQTFNPYRTADPKLQIELFGPESGVGSGFRFNGKDGKGTQTVAAVEPDRSVDFAIDLGAMGQPTQRVEFTPESQGTRVTWSMDASFGHNPIARVFGLFMERIVGSKLDQGLDNLARVTTR